MTQLATHLLDSASRRAGGVLESVRGFSKALIEQCDWRSIAIAKNDPDFKADAPLWAPTPVIFPKPSMMSFAHLDGALAREAAAQAPSIVHTHGIWGVGSRAGALLTWRRNAPRLVVSPHGMLDAWALAQSRSKKAVAKVLWANRLLLKAGCLHALSASEAASIAAVAPGRPICVIPNGVELPMIESTDAPPREKVLLFLGRIHRKKGLSELLNAWAKATARNAGWRLEIAGWDDGGHEQGLKVQAAQLGLNESVRFVGAAFGKDKERLFRRASAFVLTSFSEGLPMTVLEAWSYGNPVLMTKACNLSEGFEVGAAQRCEPNPESIAVGLNALLESTNEETRRAMGTRGRKLVEARFVWPVVTAKLAAVYEWLLGGRKPETVRLSAKSNKNLAAANNGAYVQ